MGINEKGEFVRDSPENTSQAKPQEQLDWERRQQLKVEVRRRRENEESLEGLPKDVIEEVRNEDQGLANRRKEIRERLSGKS